MPLSKLNPYLDVVTQHLSDLMVDADSWPTVMQVNLYSFWTNLDQMTTVLLLPQTPVRQIRACLSDIWSKLEALEQGILDGEMSWHLSMLRKALIYITHVIDELLCQQFEFPAVHITSQLQDTPSHFKAATPIRT